ncbi:MAG: ATP-dependent helicase [Nitrospiria bacterium]
MSSIEFLDDLNPFQKEAVLHPQGPLLILAGAGSGKTKVITNRYAYLVKHLNVAPSSILAVTFTNKAAEEMKTRIRHLTGISDLPWVQTFHSMAGKILRVEIEKFGITRQFMIYDKADQLSLIREAVRELNINEDLYPVKNIAGKISELKSLLITPEQFSEKAQTFGQQEKISKVYFLYREKLKSNKALDFDDLLMVLVQLFRKYPDVLGKYQNQFLHMMVDEYQDTNFAQYQIISLLSHGSRNICCVGDDDQSIYRFRGADVKNILRFEKDYPDARIIKLEQNYRSTKTILQAANRVIEKNGVRKKKELWTANQKGETIELYRLEDDESEANHISQVILSQSKMMSGGEEVFQNFSILYRTHIQSRALEESFQKNGIPYAIVGGIRFFERKEIKDILAFLRVISDRHDEVSLRRIINVPARGIGTQTLEKVSQHAKEKKIPLFEALENIEETHLLGAQSEKHIRTFTELIKGFNLAAPSTSLMGLVQLILDRTRYMDEIKKEQIQEKIENIYEFFSSVAEFQEKNKNADLGAFLDHVALFTDERDEKIRGRVRMMTLHGAKGLEFPTVFMPGMEEGLFPHTRALVDTDEMEEERRLCYVGMTRAREKLILTSVRSRRMYGSVQFNNPSRFLDDIPIELIMKKELNSPKIGAGYADQNNKARAKTVAITRHRYTNRSVIHPLWGKGVVLSVEGEEDQLRMTIRFDSAGTKKLASKFANLQFI